MAQAEARAPAAPGQVPWIPQAGPQQEAIRKVWVQELLYGGARGGGKSDYLLGDFAQDVPGPGGESWHGVLFRRTYPQLEELIKRSQEMYPLWFDPGGRGLIKYMAGEKIWRWANGATLKLRFLEEDDDWMAYHGHQYTWLGFDELTTWPDPGLYNKLKATLRTANKNATNLRIRASANPGGPGHTWVKEYFGIDRYPMGGQLLVDPDTKRTRMFIKARVDDNKILLAATPGYKQILAETGSKEQVKAWLDGDWDIVQGAFFDDFESAKHVIEPFEVPVEWTRIRCMDWGSASPFAVYWIAISDGSPVWVAGEEKVYPRGAMIVYRELYGAKPDKGKWVGLKLDDPTVASHIEMMEKGERIDDAVIDPSACVFKGGPSNAETIARATDGRVMFRRADNNRLGGWAQVRRRLQGGPEGPMLYIFGTCTHLIRTLPSLPHDATKIEDVDTDAEDHAADALRYGCMTRPWVQEKPKPPAPVAVGYRLDDLWLAREGGVRHSRI